MDMNYPRIASIHPMDGKKLQITFDNGTVKIYDCTLLLNRKQFQLLKNDAFFKAAKVDPGGYGVSWDDQIDLSEYELWENGVEVEFVPHK